MNQQVSAQNPLNDTDEFFRQLHRTVDNNKSLEREETKEDLIDKSDNALKYTDIPFIPGVEVLRSATLPENKIKIQVPDQDHRSSSPINIRDKYGLFENNEVLIQGDFQGDPIRAQGKIVEIDAEIIIVVIKRGTASKSNLKQRLPLSDRVSIGELLNPVTYHRRSNAIRRAKGHPIAPYLVGDEPLEFSHRRVCNTRKLDSDLYENEMQKRGIEKALRAERLACLQGPPGTGKTRVIIELARRLDIADNTVLITAETNAAVDNILVGSSTSRKLDENSLLYYHRHKDLQVARTNISSENTHPVARKQLNSSDPQSANIVVSTNSSAADLSARFDYTIIDEASQAPVSSSLIPITRADQSILVGDHKQLPPFSRRQNKTRKSIFEHLYAEDGVYGPEIGTRFETQYRMHEDIANFSSDEFYGGDLHTAESAGQADRSLNLIPIALFDISGSYEQGSDSKKNPKEAEYVLKQIRMLIKNKGWRGNQIGIAAAYREQVEDIEKRIEQSDLRSVNDLKVDTFDSFQGSERDAMILSFTRSNNDGNIGFLSDEIGQRRLNVALTRGKRYCALVGDWDTLREGSNLYERLYDYVRDTGGVKNDPLKNLV